MSKQVQIEITDVAQLAIDRYTNLSEQKYTDGGMSHVEWEHARSYAVEALKAILYANPTVFDYKPRLDAAREKQLAAGRRVSGPQS